MAWTNYPVSTCHTAACLPATGHQRTANYTTPRHIIGSVMFITLDSHSAPSAVQLPFIDYGVI